MSTEQRDVEEQLRVDVDCSIQPRLLAVDLDSGLVDGDPRRLRVGGLRSLSANRCTQFQTAP
jgi:hypothetical protein